ncbi:uncharacterized protein LOC116020216 [Ipomoea triloba]|uniref:uncharacterized protein LOC116020216 n=1 Tax=Ipomoea triloba TaxID=35885 RepID=UPI00125E6EDE|nr:uncharacterized protein LOC116020216 [Ipomoea triloba]XP_031116563.1 uncharacterized protein LOC116020216 [Ipomoea triloba]XP_031116566.1 uncharacterized protein LOC116020216 [Ipomoea triloba]
MWRSISNAVSSFGQKKDSATPNQVCHEISDDDETCSNDSSGEGLECPICWESFNIVENVPYVLWCGHTICKNCMLGLKWAALKFSMHQIQIPLFISCPWCNLLTLRLVYKGHVKFPSKNFFLLWMVESRNGDRAKSPSSICRDHQQLWPPRGVSVIGNTTTINRRPHRLGNLRSNSGAHSHISNTSTNQRPQFSLHKSLDFFIHLTSKFPLVILLLLVIFAIIPSSVAIIVVYLVLTILFALPSFVVLYFSYPALDWLAREIAS